VVIIGLAWRSRNNNHDQFQSKRERGGRGNERIVFNLLGRAVVVEERSGDSVSRVGGWTVECFATSS
jgi:hypothetical protein